MTRIACAIALTASMGCGHKPAPVVTRVVRNSGVTPTPFMPAARVTDGGQPTVAVRPEPAGPPTETPAATLKVGNPVEATILEVFGVHGAAAIRVARCESGLNPRAVSRDGAVGVFQIMPRYHAWRIRAVGGVSLFDVGTNVRVAYHLWREQGWRPWTCRGVA